MGEDLYIAIATLIGTIIGAGILGIPYVVAQAGFLTGLIDIIFIGIALLFVNLYLGEVTLRTKGNHQLPGYAKIYLGRWGKGLMAFSMVFGIYGALTAYLMAEGEILKSIFNTAPLINSLIFFAIVATLVYFGLKAVGHTELITTSFILIVVFLLCAISISKTSVVNLSVFDAKKVFIPYGVVLFAFIGMAAVPEMKREISKNRKRLKTAIIIGSLIPLVVYALFAFAVVGIVGIDGFSNLPEGQRIATIALQNSVAKELFIFANIFAVLAMGTSFIALGMAIKDMFHYDYGLSTNLSWFVSCFFPLIIFLIDAFVIDVTNFISTLGIAGSISGGIAGFLIILMFWKAKKQGKRKPEYSIAKNNIWGYVIMAMFLLGIVHEIWRLF